MLPRLDRFDMDRGFSMRIVHAIDRNLVTEIEKLSHHIQRLTGYDCISVAKIPALALVLINLYQSLESDIPGVTLVSGGMALYFLGHFYTGLYRRMRESAYHRGLARVANPAKGWTLLVVMRVALTVYCVWLMSFSDSSLLSSADMYALFVWAYLIACDPLPDCRGKIGEWIDTGLMKLTPVKVGNR